MKKFNIEVEMKERWVSHFLSMLKHMEHLGNIGSSEAVGLYSDGDGDFRPKFKFDIDHEQEKPINSNRANKMYDAG